MSDKTCRQNLKFCFRIGNLELTSCDENLMHEKVQDRAEISEWSSDNSYRWVIATFHRHHESNFDLHFVGDRPLSKTVKWRDFKRLIRMGLTMLKHQS